MDSLRRSPRPIYDHTVPGGVWINSDVCGPDGRTAPVDPAPAPPTTATTRHRRAVISPTCRPPRSAAYVGGLSTRARLDQFAVDFPFPFAVRGPSATDGSVRLELGDAMDYLTRKDYTDNWLSETQEQFCGLEFADWKALLTDVGFEVDPPPPPSATTGSSTTGSPRSPPSPPRRPAPRLADHPRPHRRPPTLE